MQHDAEIVAELEKLSPVEQDEAVRANLDLTDVLAHLKLDVQVLRCCAKVLIDCVIAGLVTPVIIAVVSYA
jgi:hypothetical protein